MPRETKRIRDDDGSLVEVVIETTPGKLDVKEISRTTIIDKDRLFVTIHNKIVKHLDDSFQANAGGLKIVSDDLANEILNELLDKHGELFK